MMVRMWNFVWRVRRMTTTGTTRVAPNKGNKRARNAIRTRDTRFRRAVLYPLSYPGNR